MKASCEHRRGGPGLPNSALENLHFIRQTLERSSAFSGVSGQGWTFLALTVPIAAWIAHGRNETEWLTVWGIELLVAVAVGTFFTLKKCRAIGAHLGSGAGRRFVGALATPLMAGAVLTAVMIQHELVPLLPGLWLLLYGVAITTGGAFSVRAVPVAGGCFMTLGGLTFLAPAALNDALMAAGFGGLHLIFGLLIWKRHGG